VYCPTISAASAVGSVMRGRDRGLWKATVCSNGCIKWVPTKKLPARQSIAKTRLRKAGHAVKFVGRVQNWGGVGDCCAKTVFVDPHTSERIPMSLAPSMIKKKYPKSWLATKLSGEPVYKIVRTVEQLQQAVEPHSKKKVYYGLRRDATGEFHTAGSSPSLSQLLSPDSGHTEESIRAMLPMSIKVSGKQNQWNFVTPANKVDCRMLTHHSGGAGVHTCCEIHKPDSGIPEAHRKKLEAVCAKENLSKQRYRKK
jgi:hypothetical protein